MEQISDIIDHRSVLDKGFIKLQKMMGDERDVIAAARISVPHSKWTSGDEKLLKYLYDHEHTSPFEQVTLKFHIKCPLFVIVQWKTHRTWNYWSYNQISSRYTEMKDEFYVPDRSRLNKQSTNNKQGSSDELIKNPELALSDIHYAYSVASQMYKNLLNQGVAKELARIVLPESIYTEVIATVNLWNLLNFLRQRADSHAQYEIRVYAEAIRDMLQPILPYTIGMIFNKENMTSAAT